MHPLYEEEKKHSLLRYFSSFRTESDQRAKIKVLEKLLERLVLVRIGTHSRD